MGSFSSLYWLPTQYLDFWRLFVSFPKNEGLWPSCYPGYLIADTKLVTVIIESVWVETETCFSLIFYKTEKIYLYFIENWSFSFCCFSTTDLSNWICYFSDSIFFLGICIISSPLPKISVLSSLLILLWLFNYWNIVFCILENSSSINF